MSFDFFYNRMTQNMRDQLLAEEWLREEALLCHDKAFEASYAEQDPYTEHGPCSPEGLLVVSGSKTIIKNIAEYWTRRRKFAVDFLLMLYPANRAWIDEQGLDIDPAKLAKQKRAAEQD